MISQDLALLDCSRPSCHFYAEGAVLPWLPTSVLSNHTGFESFFFDDYTEKMTPYIAEWKKLGLQFDGICSGFLGIKEADPDRPAVLSGF